jgi:hypothetical protein
MRSDQRQRPLPHRIGRRLERPTTDAATRPTAGPAAPRDICGASASTRRRWPARNGPVRCASAYGQAMVARGGCYRTSRCNAVTGGGRLPEWSTGRAIGCACPGGRAQTLSYPQLATTDRPKCACIGSCICSSEWETLLLQLPFPGRPIAWWNVGGCP